MKKNLQYCQCIEYEKNSVAKVTKSFAYKICTLILLKKFFANDKHVNRHLIEKQTQKTCRRICHNNLSLLKENQHRFDIIYHIVNFIFYFLIERNDASKCRQSMW